MLEAVSILTVGGIPGSSVMLLMTSWRHRDFSGPAVAVSTMMMMMATVIAIMA